MIHRLEKTTPASTDLVRPVSIAELDAEHSTITCMLLNRRPPCASFDGRDNGRQLGQHAVTLNGVHHIP